MENFKKTTEINEIDKSGLEEGGVCNFKTM